MILTGYSDVDWAGDLTQRRSTSGFAFILGGGMIHCGRRKQTVTATSTAESELIALHTTICECVWLRQILYDIGLGQKEPTTMYVDSEAAIAMMTSKNPSVRNRHIDVKLCR